MAISNWMKGIPDATPVSMINIPGSHDSTTQFINLSLISRCQNKSIRQQLESGIRFLDIRLFLNDNRLLAVHGIADCRTAKNRKSPPLLFNDVYREMKSFLEKHPSETVLMLLNEGRGRSGNAFFDAFYEQFIKPAPSCWFSENRLPVLAECRGKLVLLRRCGLGNTDKTYTDKNTGINFTNMGEQGSTKSALPLPCPFDRLGGGPAAESAVIQDRYMFQPAAKWEKAVKPALDNANPGEKTAYVHYLSTAGPPFVPRFNSMVVNHRFKGYTLKSGKPYGWIIMDFPDDEMIAKVAQSNFSVVSDL